MVRRRSFAFGFLVSLAFETSFDMWLISGLRFRWGDFGFVAFLPISLCIALGAACKFDIISMKSRHPVSNYVYVWPFRDFPMDY